MARTPFGKYVRAQRKASRYTQGDLAKALGVSQSYVSEVESGRRAAFSAEYWPAIVKLLPTATLADLQRAAAMTRPLEIDLSEASTAQADLALAVALGLRSGNLGDTHATALLDTLQRAIATPVRAQGRVVDAGGAPISGRAFAYRLVATRAWSALVGVRTFARSAAGPFDSRTASLTGKGFDLLTAEDPRGAGFFDVPGGLPPGEYALDVHHTATGGAERGDWAWPLVVTEGAEPHDVRIVCATSTPSAVDGDGAAPTSKPPRGGARSRRRATTP